MKKDLFFRIITDLEEAGLEICSLSCDCKGYSNSTVVFCGEPYFPTVECMSRYCDPLEHPM